MKKVLILEDEVSIRSFVVINLKRAGYEVVEAGTGEEALELLKVNPDVGVAILDIMLPGIDGFEVCRNIRATDKKNRYYYANCKEPGDGQDHRLDDRRRRLYDQTL